MKWSDPTVPMYYVRANDRTLVYGPYSTLGTAKGCVTRFSKDYYHRNSKFTIEEHVSTCVKVIEVNEVSE
jgi:hypothetical protein